MSKWTSEQLAWKIRRHGVEMTHLSGGSHIGAIMSVADIIAVLYTDVLNYKSVTFTFRCIMYCKFNIFIRN